MTRPFVDKGSRSVKLISEHQFRSTGPTALPPESLKGEYVSEEFRSGIKGGGTGAIIGFGFGIAVLSTIGFDRTMFFEAFLLISCSLLGGFTFGALAGITGAFRKASLELAPLEVRTAAMETSRIGETSLRGGGDRNSKSLVDARNAMNIANRSSSRH